MAARPTYQPPFRHSLRSVFERLHDFMAYHKAWMAAPDNILLFHNLHPPTEVRVFSVPAQGIRRWDAATLVYDVRIGGYVLRHYSWAERWFEINCTLGLDGSFVAEQGVIDYCFNCDISSPHFNVGHNFYNTDLYIDVLVGTDGRTHVVIDRDEFAEAVDRGWITAAEAMGARRGLAELLEVIQSGELISFLDHIYPFADVLTSAVQPPMEQKNLQDVPILVLHRR